VIEPGVVPDDEACVTDLDRYWHLKVCRWSDVRAARVFAERPDPAHEASRTIVEELLDTGSPLDVVAAVTDLLSRCSSEQERINVGAYEVENLANLRPEVFEPLSRELAGTPEGELALSAAWRWSDD
jgi:hypothetical protein